MSRISLDNEPKFDFLFKFETFGFPNNLSVLIKLRFFYSLIGYPGPKAPTFFISVSHDSDLVGRL